MLLVQIFVFVSVVELSVGSLGDTSHEFSFCKDTCVASKCGVRNKQEVEWWLKLTGWSCRDNCLYSCMHEVTAEHIRLGKPIRQFFGKVVILYIYIFCYLLCGCVIYSGHLYDCLASKNQRQCSSPF